MTDQKVYSQDSLSEALSCRYPSVWVFAQDSVEVIDHIRTYIGQYNDLSFYMMDIINGLQKYNYYTNRFDTVLVVIVNMMTGEEELTPVYKIDQAMDMVLDDGNSTLVLANAEQYENNFNDMFTFMNLSWRTGWNNNSYDDINCQVIMCSSTTPAPPTAIIPFTTNVSVGYPSASQLAQTLSHIAENMETKDLDIDAIAKASRGLTSFEATKLYQSSIARTKTVDVKELEDITFRQIAERTNLTIVRPAVSLDDVAGAENIKKILDTSRWLRENPDEAQNFGVSQHMHRFMMLGLPGVGKSYMCEAAAKYLNLNLVRTGLSHMLSKWHGESENNVKAMFDQINALDPVCVWFDEFGRDAAGGQSSHLVDAGSTSRTHGLFLTGMQELADTTYLFAAANDISTLAPEMLRADRFDKIFFVGLPTFKHRHQILSGLLAKRTHNVDITKAAQASASYTGAELKSVIASASQIALAERRHVATADVMNAMSRSKNRLWLRHRIAVTDAYKIAYDQYEWASDDQRAEAKSYIDNRLPSSDIPVAAKTRDTITSTVSIQ